MFLDVYADGSVYTGCAVRPSGCRDARRVQIKKLAQPIDDAEGTISECFDFT